MLFSSAVWLSVASSRGLAHSHAARVAQVSTGVPGTRGRGPVSVARPSGSARRTPVSRGSSLSAPPGPRALAGLGGTRRGCPLLAGCERPALGQRTGTGPTQGQHTPRFPLGTRRDGALGSCIPDGGGRRVSAVVVRREARATGASRPCRGTRTIPGTSPSSGTRAATWSAHTSNAALISSCASCDTASLSGDRLSGPGGGSGQGTPIRAVPPLTTLDHPARRLGYPADRGAGPSRGLRPEAGHCRSSDALWQLPGLSPFHCTRFLDSGGLRLRRGPRIATHV